MTITPMTAGHWSIGIDCGSGYPEEGPDSRYGRLACLRLEDGRVFYSQEEKIVKKTQFPL